MSKSYKGMIHAYEYVGSYAESWVDVYAQINKEGTAVHSVSKCGEYLPAKEFLASRDFLDLYINHLGYCEGEMDLVLETVNGARVTEEPIDVTFGPGPTVEHFKKFEAVMAKYV